MSVNLEKFKYDLVEGWREVMDSKNPIDWAIFGYDGQSFDLKLVTKGTNGIEEMVDFFNSGRIMYGLCRVKIKDRNIEKIALINWQGEGAPLARKGTCANHVSTVKHFLKGVHVTINARTDEDVDPDVIRASVAKSTSAEGVCMSSSVELDQKMDPIGAPYKKLNPQEEINAKAKDEFWRKEEVEEENRKKAEKNRQVKFSQKEVKLLRKESQDYFEHEQMEKTMTSPEPTPSPTPILPLSTNGDLNNGTATPSSDSGVGVGEPSSPTSPTFSNTFFSAEKAAVMRASAPKRNAGENLVRQRIKSFDSNPNERPLLFNSPTTNGGLRGSSESPAADGEPLSVMKRKAMFESGIVSNTSQPIIRKDPAQEIKSLQEESQNQAKAAAKSAPPPAAAAAAAPPAEQAKTPHPSHPPSAAAAASAISTIHHSLPPKSTPSPQPTTGAKPQPPQPNNVKAYNLPFHIGGGVNSRLAEKVNKNSDESSMKGKINQNGDSVSSASLESADSITMNSGGSIKSVVVQPSTVTVASTAVKAEFQADPIPQHITTNFQPKSFETTSETETEVVKIAKVPSKSPVPRTPEPEEEPTRAVRSPIRDRVTEHEDTTVQSGETTKKAPSPLPPSHPKEEKIIPAPNGTSFVIKPEMGLCARALYDYQAAEDSEITFDPGEIITNIETIDEGWWEGMGPHGLYGLFPSNYVELLN